jgi:flavodoxin
MKKISIFIKKLRFFIHFRLLTSVFTCVYNKFQQKRSENQMKTAVVFYSMSGNVRQTAERIADSITADLIELKPEKAYPDKGFKKFFWGGKSAVMGEKPVLVPYSFEADKYDRVVIGFPVWASTFAPPVRSFVGENKTALSHKSVCAFACMSGSGGQKAIDKLKELIGAESFESEMILVDPKDKPSAENDGKILAFCEAIK